MAEILAGCRADLAGAGLFALIAHPTKPLFKDGGLYQRHADGTSTKLDTSPHPNYGMAAAVGVGGLVGWWAGRLGGSPGMIIEIAPNGGPPTRRHQHRRIEVNPNDDSTTTATHAIPAGNFLKIPEPATFSLS